MALAADRRLPVSDLGPVDFERVRFLLASTSRRADLHGLFECVVPTVRPQALAILWELRREPRRLDRLHEQLDVL